MCLPSYKKNANMCMHTHARWQLHKQLHYTQPKHERQPDWSMSWMLNQDNVRLKTKKDEVRITNQYWNFSAVKALSLPGLMTIRPTCDLCHRTHRHFSQNSQGLIHQLRHYLFSPQLFYLFFFLSLRLPFSANNLSNPSLERWLITTKILFA